MVDPTQTTYRAWQVNSLSDDFSGASMVLRQGPALGPHGVWIRVRAAALNYPDILMTQGAYQFKPELPFVPGLEVAGEVVAVGDAVTHVKAGDRVVAMTRQGGLAQYLMAGSAEVRPMPEGFGWAQAAAYSVAGLTAYVALVNRGNLQPGEVLAVHGATGGTGLAAVQLGHHLGARVIATGRSLEKLAVARDAGADQLLAIGPNLRQDLIELSGGKGVDVVFDPIGGDVFDASMRALAWGGRLLVIGFVSGRAAEVRSNYALIKGTSVVGVRAGEFVRRDPTRGAQAIQAVDAMASKGVLRPPIHAEYPLDQALDAMRLMASGGVRGKLVVCMD